MYRCLGMAWRAALALIPASWQAAVPPHEMYMPMQVEGSWRLHRRDICMIKIPVSVWLIRCRSSAVIFFLAWTLYSSMWRDVKKIIQKKWKIQVYWYISRNICRVIQCTYDVCVLQKKQCRHGNSAVFPKAAPPPIFSSVPVSRQKMWKSRSP